MGLGDGAHLLQLRRRLRHADNSVVVNSVAAHIRTGGKDVGGALPRKRCAMRRITIPSWGELRISPGQRSGATCEPHRYNLQEARGAPPMFIDGMGRRHGVESLIDGPWVVRHRPGARKRTYTYAATARADRRAVAA